jgi:hypothetical protein
MYKESPIAWQKYGKRSLREKSNLSCFILDRGTKKRAKELVELAVDTIHSIGFETEPLREIARSILPREY